MDTVKNLLLTDDLAFSAWLKMKGYQLIKSNQQNNKSIFSFSLGEDDKSELKIQFLNSSIIQFYNEIRNLKKII